jgi:hypothetical protein
MLFGFPLVFILGGNRLSLLNKRKPFLLKVIYTKVVMKGGAAKPITAKEIKKVTQGQVKRWIGDGLH